MCAHYNAIDLYSVGCINVLYTRILTVLGQRHMLQFGEIRRLATNLPDLPSPKSPKVAS